MKIRNWFDRLVFGFTTLFDALGVELPKRSGIQFTGLSVTDDAANDRLVIGPAFPTIQEEFTGGIIALDSDRTILVDPAPSHLYVAPAPGELHKDGAQKVLLLYPETVTTLEISPALNVRGDFTVNATTGAPVGWDGDLWTILAITRAGPKFATMAIQFADFDEGIPAVLSATVYGTAPDEIEVVYSKRCVAYATTGMQLSSGAGVSIAAGAPLSGNGTATHTYQLSGALDGDEVFDLSILPSRKVQSINGPLVGVSTTAVTLSFGLAQPAEGVYRLKASDYNAATGTWTDLWSHANSFSQGTVGKRPTVNASAINGKPSVVFDGVDDWLDRAAVLMGGIAIADKTHYSIFAVMKFAGTTDDIVVDHSNTTLGAGGSEFSGPMAIKEANVFGFSCPTFAHKASVGSFTATTWMKVKCHHTPTGRKHIVNATTYTSAAADNPAAIVGARIGAGVETGAYPFAGEIAELILVGSNEDGTAFDTAVDAYFLSEYGV